MSGCTIASKAYEAWQLGEKSTLSQKAEPSAAEHPPHQHLDAVDAPFHDSGAPGERGLPHKRVIMPLRSLLAIISHQRVDYFNLQLRPPDDDDPDQARFGYPIAGPYPLMLDTRDTGSLRI